ncbi:MAG: hypothetical protein WBP12_00500 [Candidatus Saccharimonas sp.]
MGSNTATLQDNQMVKFAIVMAGSVITAVTVSVAIIMSLMGGPNANALTTQNNNAQMGAGVGVCVDPNAAPEATESEAVKEGEGQKNLLLTPQAKAGYVRPLLAHSISGSFNTTNSNSTTTITTNTFNNTTTTIKDNGNSYSASWNNGNTAVYAPTTTTTTNTSQNNGNTNNQNNGNSSTTSNTVKTTTNTTTTTVQDNGNTNNQNNGNTTENNPTTTTTTNTSQNNGNQDNDNNGNTYSAEASIF